MNGILEGVEWRLCNVMFLRYSISNFRCMSNNQISSVILLLITGQVQ